MLSVSRAARFAASSLAGLLALACPLVDSAWADPIDALRRGGVTLLMRPAPSDWSQEATEFAARAKGRFDPKDCRTQRNLSLEGRDDARLIGLALKTLKLHVIEVDAAPLCRAVDTANLAFGEVKVTDDLASRAGGALAAARTALVRIVGTPTPDHAIRVVVAEYDVAQGLFGRMLGEGDALVLKSSGGSIEPVATIALDDWRAFAPVAQTGQVSAVAP